MPDRNRSEGWRHAKLSGHENEALVETITKLDADIQKRILNCAGKYGEKIDYIDYGGLNEKEVDSVLGGKTKSKTDMHIFLKSGEQINVSIKKSLAGQVYLIHSDRFIAGFERQFRKAIPTTVKRAISLFWGTADDTEDVISRYAMSNRAYELRKHRIVLETLNAYDETLSKEMLGWFNDNIKDIFMFCFGTGLASSKHEWADIVWYNNQLGEIDIDEMFNICELAERLPHNAEYGSRTGGSTIQLPFGFVQWHQGCMQFHHKYNQIKRI